jgi:hypothetical protein
MAGGIRNARVSVQQNLEEMTQKHLSHKTDCSHCCVSNFNVVSTATVVEMQEKTEDRYFTW